MSTEQHEPHFDPSDLDLKGSNKYMFEHHIAPDVVFRIRSRQLVLPNPNQPTAQDVTSPESKWADQSESTSGSRCHVISKQRSDQSGPTNKLRYNVIGKRQSNQSEPTNHPRWAIIGKQPISSHESVIDSMSNTHGDNFLGEEDVARARSSEEG